jgi:hypothetical protein
MLTKFAIALVLGATVAVAIVPLAGCHDVPGHKGIRDNMGTYRVQVSAAPDTTIAAAREVVEDMKLKIVIYTTTKSEGKLVAQNATDKTFTITTSAEGDRVSTLEVKIGNGEKDASLAMIDKIKAKL